MADVIQKREADRWQQQGSFMAKVESEFAVKGALTRIALYFNAQGQQQFTGEEVAVILLAAWQSYEVSKEKPEEFRMITGGEA